VHANPADGFYEWKKEGKTKQSYCFEVNEGKLSAGLWDHWMIPQGELIESCSILTSNTELAQKFRDFIPAFQLSAFRF
jgi:putative SOS response-associated peptidase YedK